MPSIPIPSDYDYQNKSQPLTPSSPAIPKERQDEVDVLGDLNKRLESYIERQRERDMRKDMLDKKLEKIKFSIRESADREIANLNKMHECQVAEIRESREGLSKTNAELQATISRLQGEQARQASMLKKVTDALKDKKKKCDSLVAEKEKLGIELKSESLKKKHELEKMANDLSTSQGENIVVREELDLIKKKLEKYTTDLATLQMKHKTLGEDKELQKLNQQQKIEQLQRELQKLRQLMSESSIRDLEEQLELIRTRCSQEKEELRQELLLGYNKQFSEQQKKIETLQQTLANVQKENESLILKNEKLEPKASNAPELEAELAALNTKMDQKQAKILELEQVQKTLSEKVTKERFERLSAEEKFKGLYDVNVNLKAAIKRYDYLLRHGEDHLQSSPRKRKYFGSMEVDHGGKQEGVQIHFAFDEGELNKSHKVQGSIKIINYDTEKVSLQHWYLRSKETGAIFRFPDDAVLHSKQESLIFVGKDNTDNILRISGKKPDYKWVEENVFRGNSGEAELVDDTGTVIWSEKFAVTVLQD